MSTDFTSYMVVAEFRQRTIMPMLSVDELEAREPGYLQQCLDDWSAWINTRLAKRYDVPFGSPHPKIVLLWLTRLVTPEAYAKLGWSPSGESDRVSVLDPAARAMAEIKEAADAKDGLFELPLRADTAAGGVSRTAPITYTETSPYKWTDIQAETGRGEDRR